MVGWSHLWLARSGSALVYCGVHFATWQSAHRNKQERNQNEPAKDDSNQPWSVARAKKKEKAKGPNPADRCEELRPKFKGFVAGPKHVVTGNSSTSRRKRA